MTRPPETPIERVRRSARGIGMMLSASRHIAGDRRSYAQLVADTFIYRLLRVTHIGHGRPRSVRLRNGDVLTYRADRGDIGALVETWISGVYDIPVDVGADGVILDLGANIGVTGVFLARKYRPAAYVAVEPVPGNAELARRNLAANGVPAEIIEAVIGPEDGEATFVEASASTLGQVGPGGSPVPMVTVDTALKAVDPLSRIALVKMDIEGGEATLFSRNTDWLERVDCLVAELHPDFCDLDGVLATLGEAGFVERRFDAGEQRGQEYMAYFVRPTNGDG